MKIRMTGLAALALTLASFQSTVGAAEPAGSEIPCKFASSFGVVVEREFESLNEVRLVVAVSDFSLMGKCLSEGCASIDGAIHASGNVLSFKCDGTEVSLKALPGHDLNTESEPTAAEPSSYEQWASSKPASSLLEGMDPDGDGITNLMEYALGLDPLKADGGALSRAVLTGVDDEKFLSLTYQRDLTKTDVLIEVQVSSDLSPDSWTTDSIEDEVESVNNGIENRVARVRLGDKRQFLRLSVRRIH